MSDQPTAKLDLIIVGAGPAGLFGGYYAGLLDMTCLIVEQSANIGGTPTNFFAQKVVYDYPGSLKTIGATIIHDLHEQLKSVSEFVTLKTSTAITKADLKDDGVAVTLHDGSVHEAHYLVLCTGTGLFEPVPLDKAPPNANVKLMVGDVNDFANKRVVVLGGGDSAVDWANMFGSNGLAKQVTIVHRRREWTAKPSSLAKLAENGVRKLSDCLVTEVRDDALTVVGNETKEAVVLPYDVVLVQYGQKMVPTTITDLPLDKHKNKFVVKSNMLTSHPRVFAAGSGCVYDGKVNTIVNAMAEAVTAVVGARHFLGRDGNTTFYSSMNEKKVNKK